ncbi:MAG: BBP7 family outer membrane beta-barrel protein [Gemmataceae bacterium]
MICICPPPSWGQGETLADAQPPPEQEAKAAALLPPPVFILPGNDFGQPCGVPLEPESPRAAPALYAGFEYLLWSLQDAPLPPLTRNQPAGFLNFVTTDLVVSPAGTSVARILSRNVPVFITVDTRKPQGSSVDFGSHGGGRLKVGYHPGQYEGVALEASYYQVEQRSFGFGSAAVSEFGANTPFAVNTIVVSPFSPTEVLQEPVFLPGRTANQTLGSVGSQLWGAEAQARAKFLYWENSGFDLLAGFRYVDLREHLTLLEDISLQLLPSPPNVLSAPEFRFASFETVRTRNSFYGGQVGLGYNLQVGRFFLHSTGKIALGGMQQVVTITSISETNTGGVRPGGLLFGPADIGKHAQNRIAVIPELNARFGCALTDWLSLFVGYDLFFLQQVVRPGNQVGFSSNTTQITILNTPTTVNVQQPGFVFRDSGFRVQGINFGLELRY